MNLGVMVTKKLLHIPLYPRNGTFAPDIVFFLGMKGCSIFLKRMQLSAQRRNPFFGNKDSLTLWSIKALQINRNM